jgi:hypothetical protein
VLLVGFDGIVGNVGLISVKRGSGRWNCVLKIGVRNQEYCNVFFVDVFVVSF